MKIIILSLVILKCSVSFAQSDSVKNPVTQKQSTGYGFITAGAFVTNERSNFYPSLGFGIRIPYAAIGVVFYYNKDLKGSIHGDLRVLFAKNKKAIPFVSVQPGKQLYNKSASGIKVTGGAALNVLFGVMMNIKKGSPGPYFSVGYGMYKMNTTVSSKHTSANVEGVLVSMGLKF